jgi:hypothetical protein
LLGPGVDSNKYSKKEIATKLQAHIIPLIQLFLTEVNMLNLHL